MAAKVRCTVCRNYFAKEEILHRSIGNICSEECLSERQSRATVKRKQSTVRTKVIRRRRDGMDPVVREQCRSRDNHQCRMCGRTNVALHLHHVRYRSEGGPDVPENLMTLCHECHALVHSDKRQFQPTLFVMMWAQYRQQKVIPFRQCRALLEDEETADTARAFMYSLNAAEESHHEEDSDDDDVAV